MAKSVESLKTQMSKIRTGALTRACSTVSRWSITVRPLL